MSCGAGVQLNEAACLDSVSSCHTPHHTHVESNESATSGGARGSPAVGSGSLCTRRAAPPGSRSVLLTTPAAERMLSPHLHVPQNLSSQGGKVIQMGSGPRMWRSAHPGSPGGPDNDQCPGKRRGGAEEVAGGMGAGVAGAESSEDTALRHGTSDPWLPE